MKSKSKLLPKPKPNRRAGIHMRGHRGHPVVCKALIRYLRWLRANFEFPIRVPVYLFPNEMITKRDGSECSASFVAPFDRKAEPFIRIATGDYDMLRRARGRDNALAAYLGSLSHEVIHYRQWIETGNLWEEGVIKKAYAMVDRYALTVDHP